MLRNHLLRIMATALVMYGLLGFFVAGAMAYTGYATFAQLQRLRAELTAQSAPLVRSLQAVSQTIGNAANTTSTFNQSMNAASRSADTASRLAFDSSHTFRGLAQAMNVEVLGVQPFTEVIPRFNQSADQLLQLAITLGDTRDSLSTSGAGVQQVGANLRLVQEQVDDVADQIQQTDIFGVTGADLMPFQTAYFGVCILFGLQSLFSLVVGIALMRLAHSIRTLAEMIALHRAHDDAVDRRLHRVV